MSAETPRRAPIALDLSTKTVKARAPVIVEQGDFNEVVETPAAPAAKPAKRRFSWLGGLLGGAVISLALLFFADAIWDLVLRLSAKNPVLGQVGLALVGLLVFVLLAWFGRELVAILRLRKVDALRAKVSEARAVGREAEARAAIAALTRFYTGDATTAAGRARLADLEGGIHDAPVLLDEAERHLLQAKDDAARNLIGQAAQRVSIVTAVSPRALVDILFVLAQSIRLIRDLSALYGGRASGFGLVRLGARILGHLAITGGVAAADEVVSQVMGSGLAARLSARLGEGVLNGVLTARIGIAAVALCRPMDFVANKPVILSEVAITSIIQKEVAEKPAG